MEEAHCRFLKVSNRVSLQYFHDLVLLSSAYPYYSGYPMQTESGFVLCDNSSRQGTFVNGIRVHPPSGMLIFPGESISTNDSLVMRV